MWAKTAVYTATTEDGYFFITSAQPEGVPMALYADGTVEADHYKGYIQKGTWEVQGSGSGAGTLVVKNESGQPLAFKVDGTKATFTQDGVYYDWNQPDMGYGSGVFLTSLAHTIDLDAFTKAYNEAEGTSYTSMGIEAGSASFELQESGEPKSTF